MKTLKILFFVHVLLVAIAFYALFDLHGGYEADKSTIKRLKSDSADQKKKNLHLQGMLLCDTLHKNCIRY